MHTSDNQSLFCRALGRYGRKRPPAGTRPVRALSRTRVGRTRMALAASATAGAAALLTAPATLASANPVNVVAPSPAGASSSGASTVPQPAALAATVQAAMSNFPIVGLAPTSDAQGYWMTATNGGVFSFGDAAFHGSLGAVALAKPIVGMAATPDGGGYWLVASDGGVFSFGDAAFHGSTGAVNLAKPIVGMARSFDGRGYWLVASDGGVFSFGDAAFHGSTGAVNLARPIASMATTPDGRGYWLAGSDGGVFAFGDAPYRGSAVAFNSGSGGTSVGIIPVQTGYWMPNNLGGVAAFGAPQPPAPSQPVVDLSVPTPAPSSPTSTLSASQNPSVSIGPSSAFAQSCWGSSPNVAACNAAALADINSARAGEGLGSLVLPSNFYNLAAPSQLVAVANAERTSRGLPAMPENGTLDRLAQQGAVGGYDPVGPSNYSWGSNIAWGDATALAADFGWMYDDGPNSPNIDCTPGNSSGCWGHRDNILSPWSGSAGAGSYVSGGTVQLTQLFVENY